MVRIESDFRDVIIRRRRWRKPITQRVCALTIYLRFDHAPDVDFIQVDGCPCVFMDSGDDIQINLPPTLVTIR